MLSDDWPFFGQTDSKACLNGGREAIEVECGSAVVLCLSFRCDASRRALGTDVRL
jgi:hypothetical protein